VTASLSLWASGALIGAALVVAALRPAWTIEEARAALRPLAALLVAGAALFVVAIAARRYVEVVDYLVAAARGTATFLAILFLARRAIRSPGRLSGCLASLRPWPLAAGVFVAASVAGLVVMQGVPHVSDEVAYLFEARTHALGRLWVEAPRRPEFLQFTHTLIEDGRWYGIMNPGWPFLLALGVLVGVPWAVAPLLGALTLPLLFGFYRKAGLDAAEAGVAVALIAVSPFFLFMSGTYMSHAASLFAFAGFLWGWIGHRETGRPSRAAVAGGFLALGILVRPVDAAASALPFLLISAWRGLGERRRLGGVAVLGVVSSIGVWITLAYNRVLTGSALEFPVTRYFMLRDPGQRFGLGFGPDMGTTIHGPEWPGYYPLDAIPVSGYRITEFLRDVNALPVVFLALLGWSLIRDRARRGVAERALVWSAVALVLVYALHFYHGIAYGSRHYYLALPAIAVLLARPVVRWARDAREGVSGLAVAGLVAGLAYTALFAYPPLVREYSDAYRGASGWVRDAVRDAGLDHALVFVEPGDWAWKSAFPLNGLPIDANRVLFVRDLGEEDRELVADYPDRVAYRLRREDGAAVLEPFDPEAPR